jgi:hypothetical protein
MMAISLHPATSIDEVTPLIAQRPATSTSQKSEGVNVTQITT